MADVAFEVSFFRHTIQQTAMTSKLLSR